MLGLLVGMSGEIGLAALIESVLRVKLPNPGLLGIPLPIVLSVLAGRLWARQGPESPAIDTQLGNLFSTLMLCVPVMLDFAWLASPGAEPSGWAETLFFFGVSLGPLAGLVSALFPDRRGVAT